jgi:serine/threonine-protein phosphatase 5
MTEVEKIVDPQDIGIKEIDTNLKKTLIDNSQEIANSVSPEDLVKANAHKDEGNNAFKEQNYSKAIECYSLAIECNPNEASYYGNRSFAYIKSEFYGYALNDANKAIELDPKYIKGYYRRASSNMALVKYKLALKDYEYVVKVHPTDKDAQAKFNECKKINQRIAFEKAIAVDEIKKSAFDLIDIENLRKSNLEADYKGPKLEDETRSVTLNFVMELIECFKEQKVLHKKFAYEILFQIRDFFSKSPTLVDIDLKDENKFTICGDIHGQFYDLLNIFKLNGWPSETNPYVRKNFFKFLKEKLSFLY